MQNFSLLIKPASADCNNRCRYCFYLEKSKLFPESKIHRMDYDTLKTLVHSYMKTQQQVYTFGWQGGEPLLMGLDFYKNAVNLQKKYAKSGSVVANSIQTNATLINDDFAEFFKKYNFLIGVSLDGPQYIHDRYRKSIDGSNTFKKVMKGIEILKKHNVEYNALVLVNDFNVGKAKEIFKFLLENEIYYHQYIPCLEYDENGKPLSYSISAEQWGMFLIELFNLWYPDYINKVSVRLFDSIINKIVNLSATICHMDKNCGQYIVVEHNGNCYPCDFFVEKELEIGNINHNSLEEIINSPIYSNFCNEKPNYSFLCSTCPYIQYCYGDCLKYRSNNINGFRRLSGLCSGWKMFYQHSIEKFNSISNLIKN